MGEDGNDADQGGAEQQADECAETCGGPVAG